MAVTPTTSEATWMKWLQETPEWTPAEKRTIVVAPHPDDETLGAGGLIATQRARQVPVKLLAVTDGEAAYPGVSGLGAIRRQEQTRAADALGISPGNLVHLALPDSDVSRYESALVDAIEACLDRDTLLVAPWALDPHPDHEACGRAAAQAARRAGATLVGYFFWTWHHFSPERLEGLPLGRLALTEEARKRRATALACHESQLQREQGQPILPEHLLAPARRPFEMFVTYGDSNDI